MIECPDFLPLGSVVRLQGEDQQFMVISRGVAREEDGRKVYYDYRLCLFPEGHTNALSIYCHHNSIEKVLFKGWRNADDESYLSVLREMLGNSELTRGVFGSDALDANDAW